MAFLPIPPINEWYLHDTSATITETSGPGGESGAYKVSYGGAEGSLIRYGNFETVPVNNYYSYDCGVQDSSCRIPAVQGLLEDNSDYTIRFWAKWGNNPNGCDHFCIDGGDGNVNNFVQWSKANDRCYIGNSI